MNVDGAIGSLFLDLLAGSGMFTKQEIDEIVEIGYLNGLFVLARSIGLIGSAAFFIKTPPSPKMIIRVSLYRGAIIFGLILFMLV